METSELIERLLNEHIQRCRDAVSECQQWSPAQAEWSRARDALLNFKDDLDAALSRQQAEMRRALERFCSTVPVSKREDGCPWCLSKDHWAGKLELCPAPSSRAIIYTLSADQGGDGR